MALTPEEVSFPSSGVTLRGDLYLPETGNAPYPTVVMAGGWCYVKELRQPDYAKEFLAAGFAALIFDYRYMGASDGEPRQHIDPWQQIDDYRNAITYVESRDELDSDRIGVWGISYSGGHVVVLAAIEPRIKAAVSTVAVVDGYKQMWRNHGSERLRLLNETILEDRRNRFRTGEYGYIPMSGDPAEGLSTFPLEEIRTVFEDLRKTQAPRHEHSNTIESVELLMQYNIVPFAQRVTRTPLCMVIAGGDDITLEDQELLVYNQVPGPYKKLVVIPGTSHMRLYSDLGHLELAAKAAANWYSEHLSGPMTPERLLA